MGMKNGFSSSSVPVKICLAILFVANSLSWIAFCTTGWAYFSSSDTGYGLWRVCKATSCNQIDGATTDWWVAFQAFGCFGFISMNIAFILVLLFMFKDSCMGNGEIRIGAAFVLFFSAATWLICVAIFGGKWTKNTGGNASDLNYSFGLAVVALSLAIICGILMIVGGRSGTSPS